VEVGRLFVVGNDTRDALQIVEADLYNVKNKFMYFELGNPLKM